MVTRWTSFLLLLYLLWNNNRYELILSEVYAVYLPITKYMYPVTLFQIIICLSGTIFLVYSIKQSFEITSYIISVTMIIIVLTLAINKALLNESTDFIIFKIYHPLSPEQKINYFIYYLQEHGTSYANSLTNLRAKQYFENELYQQIIRTDLSMIVEMNVKQIQNYCDAMIQKAANETSRRHGIGGVIEILLYILIILTCY